eukprot:CAMPEP_0117422804 /NCGR_PEP_ID=MMETSP0758-20121206/3577_1 /TAXON_ID=63605 /ORGANISM="Percolomonas cosmopolitus, Strain AE-1 (ATCC 50343)" /LENGTH=36 /DNA_ID= /DNA_START= /DNA_END= /DNA_ORIENTATION=
MIGNMVSMIFVTFRKSFALQGFIGIISRQTTHAILM